MAWTTPTTWGAGQLVVATGSGPTAGLGLNDQIRDNMTILKTPFDNTGKLISLSSTYVNSLDASNLTGIPTLAGASAWTGEHDFDTGGTGRVVFPVGTDPWAT